MVSDMALMSFGQLKAALGSRIQLWAVHGQRWAGLRAYFGTDPDSALEGARLERLWRQRRSYAHMVRVSFKMQRLAHL